MFHDSTFTDQLAAYLSFLTVVAQIDLDALLASSTGTERVGADCAAAFHDDGLSLDVAIRAADRM